MNVNGKERVRKFECPIINLLQKKILLVHM